MPRVCSGLKNQQPRLWGCPEQPHPLPCSCSPAQQGIYTGKRSWEIRCCSRRRAEGGLQLIPASVMATLCCLHRIPCPLRARSRGAEDKDGLFRPWALRASSSTAIRSASVPGHRLLRQGSLCRVHFTHLITLHNKRSHTQPQRCREEDGN